MCRQHHQRRIQRSGRERQTHIPLAAERTSALCRLTAKYQSGGECDAQLHRIASHRILGGGGGVRRAYLAQRSRCAPNHSRLTDSPGGATCRQNASHATSTNVLTFQAPTPAESENCATELITYYSTGSQRPHRCFPWRIMTRISIAGKSGYDL